MVKILVVTVTYNGLQWIDRCALSVRSSVVPADFFVVDNASTDGTADYIEANYPEAELVRSRENLGFGKANNLGLRYALEGGYDYVYLLNQDAWLLPDTLGELVAASRCEPEYFVLSPLQVRADGGEFDPLFERRVLPHMGREDGAVCRVPRVMAAHWLLTAATVRKVGGFAPVFPLYGEDDNYLDRVHYFGGKAGVVTSVRGVHDRALRTESLEKTEYRNYFMNSLRILCNPCRPFFGSFAYVCAFTLVKAIKYRSVLPFKHFRELCSRLGDIRSTRRDSRSPGAFL